MSRWFLAAGLAAAMVAMPAVAEVSAKRAKTLAQFDAGYTQCEKRYPAMRGQGDVVYAGLYRLKLDDALRQQLREARQSAAYKADRRRTMQAIVKESAASDNAQKVELQCQALQREIKGGAPASAPAR